ncbi:MAG: pyridoxal phosphate-dependent aminotransferase [Candidatus Odinarchaeia archaeon]
MIDKYISNRMNVIPPSGTINMFELALSFEKQGHKMLHLEVGEPDFDTPENIRESAIEYIKKGLTHYTSSRGILELRNAISAHLKHNGVDFSADEILITPGAKHAIFCSFMALLNPGEEVIILTPAWPTYSVMVKMVEAKPVFVPTDGNYNINLDRIQENITEKTKMIVINSPNNPTGGVIEEKDMKAIADLAYNKQLLILSDEIYDKIVYDGFTQTSMPSITNVRDLTVLINGFSKVYAMTGWRLGYVAANKKFIDCMLRIQQNSTTCPTSFVQYGALSAFKTPRKVVDNMVKTFDKRRKLIVDLLNEIKGVQCTLPKGAFYVFPEYDYKIKSKELAERILKEVKVTTTPGSVFEAEYHLRLSYAVSEEVINEALGKLKIFFQNI